MTEEDIAERMNDEETLLLARIAGSKIKEANRLLDQLRPRVTERIAEYRGQRFQIGMVFFYGEAVQVSGPMIKQSGHVGVKVIGAPIEDVKFK